jgi:protein-S-isoprenylcysteine O-methyltransferase Ste14
LKKQVLGTPRIKSMIKLDKRFLQRVRIPLGFLFAAVFLVFARPTPLTLAIGGGIALIGLAIRAWASGHIRKASVLAVSGPYAYTRNPLYLGSFVLGVGFTVAAGVWWLAFVFCVLFIGIYLPVMRVEADDIRRIFGDDFDEYERNVPVFFPRFTPWQKSGGKFDFQLYLQYREYRAAVGVIFAVGVLAVKAYFLR